MHIILIDLDGYTWHRYGFGYDERNPVNVKYIRNYYCDSYAKKRPYRLVFVTPDKQSIILRNPRRDVGSLIDEHCVRHCISDSSRPTFRMAPFEPRYDFRLILLSFDTFLFSIKY